MRKVVHAKLGSRSEGVAFLCLNWNFKEKKLTNDLRITGPFSKAILRTDFDGRPVTCRACLKAME